MPSEEDQETTSVRNLQKELQDAACTELRVRVDDILRNGCEQDLLMLASNLFKAPLPSRWNASQSGFIDQKTGEYSRRTPLFPVFVRLTTLVCMARLNSAVAMSMAALVRRVRDEALQEAEQSYDQTAGVEPAAPLFIAYVSQKLLSSSAFPEGIVKRAGTLESALEKVRRKARKQTLHVTRSLSEISKSSTSTLEQESPEILERPLQTLPVLKMTRSASEVRNTSETSSGRALLQPRQVLSQENHDYFTANILDYMPKAPPIRIRARRLHRRCESSLQPVPDRPSPLGAPSPPAFYQPRHAGAR